MKRAVFSVVWSAVFVFVAALAVSAWAALGAGDDPAQQTLAAQKAGEEWGPLAVFGSVTLAVLLGAAGKLPGTAGAKRSHPEAAATRPLVQPPSRPVAPIYTQLHPELYVFTFRGFVSRWDRHIPVVLVVLAVGVSMLRSATTPDVLGVAVFVTALGFFPALFLLGRFFGLRWVSLDSSGVTWGGIFGSRHRGWEQIRNVTRGETLVNGRQLTRMLWLEFEDGGNVMFDQSIRGFAMFAGTIQAVAGELILGRKWDELQQQGEADFGRVKLRPDGIQMKNRFFSWEDLGRYRIENGHLVLYVRIRPREGGDKGTPLATIPNYPVLLTMMREGGAPLSD